MRLFASAALGAALALSGGAPAMADVFTLDKSHAAVSFTVDHLGFSLTHGRFAEFDAEIDFYPDDPAKSSVVFTIAAPSIDTGWAKRDEHVRGGDFLNVEEHPEIVFRSTAIEMTGENTARMTGELTMLGETHEEVFDVTLNKIAPSPFGNNPLTAGFSAESVIDRTKYGMGAYAPSVGAEIPVRVDLEIVKAE